MRKVCLVSPPDCSELLTRTCHACLQVGRPEHSMKQHSAIPCMPQSISQQLLGALVDTFQQLQVTRRGAGHLPMSTAMARYSRACVLHRRRTPKPSNTNTTTVLLTPAILTSRALPGALHAEEDSPHVAPSGTASHHQHPTSKRPHVEEVPTLVFGGAMVAKETRAAHPKPEYPPDLALSRRAVGGCIFLRSLRLRSLQGSE